MMLSNTALQTKNIGPLLTSQNYTCSGLDPNMYDHAQRYHATEDRQHATEDWQHATENRQHVLEDLQHATKDKVD